MKLPNFSIYLTFLLLSLLTACVPNINSVEPPTFRPFPESLTLLRLDPPGVGSGDATFRLELEVDNSNAFALSLSQINASPLFLSKPTAIASTRL